MFPANITPADQHDIADEMPHRWRDYTRWEDTDDESLSEAERTAITAPFGREWPGLCPDITLQGPPEHVADDCAEFLCDDTTRLGLVAVERGSDTLWVTGWSGPMNLDNDSGVFAAEHFAFCPDSVWQGSYKNLQEYAASLTDQNCWEFWWD